LVVDRRSANSSILSGDRAKLIEITASATTQTFDQAVNLGPDWYVLFRNTSTGPTVLNAYSGELVDGLSGYVVYPQELRMFYRNAAGTALVSVVINAFEVTFNSSGNFVKPPGYKAFEGFAWSAGASGAYNATDAQGGHGGGCFPFTLPSSIFGATEVVTIGAGGASLTSSGNQNAGGNTALGGFFTVVGADATYGGSIALSGNRVTFAAATNSALSTTFAGSEEQVSPVFTVYGGATAGTGLFGSGGSIYGGAAGGSYGASNSSTGGVSIYGGNGGNSSDTGNGVDGAQPGGGGGATRSGTRSGAGGNGRVIIRGVI
jgi:hypothetical protein